MGMEGSGFQQDAQLPERRLGLARPLKKRTANEIFFFALISSSFFNKNIFFVLPQHSISTFIELAIGLWTFSNLMMIK